MVMMGIEFVGDIPFSDVVINPIIQAPDGRRMSKSLGTGIDPLELVDAHGADAVRFGLLLMASTQDVRFNEQRIVQGRQLGTKIWNATRLVVERGGRAGQPAPTPTTMADRWITSMLAQTVASATRLVDEYDFSALADLIYHAIFDDFCDWYLELLKAGAADGAVAGYVWEQLLTLTNPMMPFVTEECFAHMPGADGMLLTHPLAVAPFGDDADATAGIAAIQEAVTALRAFRQEKSIKPRQELTVDADGLPDLDRDAVAALARVVWSDDLGEDPSPVVLPSGGRLLIARVALDIDTAAERARIDQAIAAAEGELARADRQLANERFTSRAPEHLVQAERDKAARFTSEITALRAERERLVD
jgi:valyl-tRNA synthetase